MEPVLIKSPETCVSDYLKGIQAAFPALHVDVPSQIIFLNRERGSRVALLAGCGAGHEPCGAGYVGENMLTACVGGEILGSPRAQNLVSAFEYISRLNKGGILAIIMNYTEDMLNFGLAIETARNQGIAIESVMVADDASNLHSEVKTGFIGRRGLSGAPLMFKILGALSTAGRSLKEIVIEARCINCRMSTLGFGLVPPGRDTTEVSLEIGVGINGELPIARFQPQSLQEVVKILLAQMFRTFVVGPEDNVVLLVNNLGSCKDLEMFTIANEIKDQIEQQNIKVIRMYIGSFITALNSRGALMTILNVTGRDDWIRLLDLETEAFAWPVTRLSRLKDKIPPKIKPIDPMWKLPDVHGMLLTERESNIFKSCILAVCRALVAEEEKLNQLDSECGDGDCGTALRKLADGFREGIDSIPVRRMGLAFFIMSKIAQNCMSGTSGAIYALMLLGASRNSSDWGSAWMGSFEMLKRYSIAELGYRTLLDALMPACMGYCSYIEEHGEKNWQLALSYALDKAIEGCGKTATMKPSVGRAMYCNPTKLVDVDPGAYAVVAWLSAIYKNLVVQGGEDKQCPI